MRRVSSSARVALGSVAVAATAGVLLLSESCPAAASGFGFIHTPERPWPPAVAPQRPPDAATGTRRRAISAQKRALTASTRATDSRADPLKRLSGPFHVLVSINQQRMTLYANGVAVARSAVSTGVAGHPTPTGVFSIIQRRRMHYSNLYNDAPMPFMQRLTWSGIALHAGVVPGRPASHGCIRLPAEFAQRLWGITRIGTRVIVAHDEPALVEFAHPRLAALNAAQQAQNGDRAGQRTGKSAGAAAVRLAAAEPDSVPDAPGLELPALEESGIRGSIAPIDQAVSVPMEDATREATTAAGKDVPGEPGDRAARSGDTTDPLEPAETVTGTAGAPASAASVTDMSQPAPTALPSTPGDAPPPVQSAELPVRPGPVSVLISRKERKLYVRKGFAPVFNMPVTIERPEQPIGTHVFTALAAAEGDSMLRWTVVSLPIYSRPVAPPSSKGAAKREPGRPGSAAQTALSPAEALERITIPPEASARIAGWLGAGASLIVSDTGLSHETGLETDFVVLTR